MIWRKVVNKILFGASASLPSFGALKITSIMPKSEIEGQVILALLLLIIGLIKLEEWKTEMYQNKAKLKGMKSVIDPLPARKC